MTRLLSRQALAGVCSAVLAGCAFADPPALKNDRRTPAVEVFEATRDAVVNISTTRMLRTRAFDSPLDELFNVAPRYANQRISSVGSGVVVHEAGYIVTNAHVITQASDVQITFASGKTIAAETVAVDPDNDLAVLRVRSEKPLPYTRLGNSDDIMVGETVVAIGDAVGLQHTVTAGIVSALGRDVQLREDVVYKNLIQTDAPINPGNSGGPLLNVNAEVIGINTAIRGDAQSIGFAIPVNRVWELLPDLLDIERRDRVRFGMRVTGPQANVVNVRDDSPAAKAGVRVGDRVRRFNGRDVRDSIDYYVSLLGEKPGDKVRLALDRDGKSVDASVELQVAPPPDGQKLAARLLGVTLEEIRETGLRELGWPTDVALVVTDIEPGGPADKARIRKRDLIIGLDRQTVASLEQVGLALESLRGGGNIVVEGLRLFTEPPFRWTVAVKTRTRR